MEIITAMLTYFIKCILYCSLLLDITKHLRLELQLK